MYGITQYNSQTHRLFWYSPEEDGDWGDVAYYPYATVEDAEETITKHGWHQLYTVHIVRKPEDG